MGGVQFAYPHNVSKNNVSFKPIHCKPTGIITDASYPVLLI